MVLKEPCFELSEAKPKEIPALSCLSWYVIPWILYFSSPPQEGSHQAQSNLKFLMVLKEPCFELSEAKPKEIPALLPRILNLIRMIWVNSEFYKSRERLTGILRKVGSIGL